MIIEQIPGHTDQLTEKLGQLNDPLFSSTEGILSRYRELGRLALEKLEFPSTYMEAWKYTAVKPQFEENFSIPGKQFQGNKEAFDLNYSAEIGLFSGNHSIKVKRIVLLNGLFEAELSDSLEGSGIQVISFEEAIVKNQYASNNWSCSNSESLQPDFFSMLNQAGGGRGIYVNIEKGIAPDFDLHIQHIFDSADSALIQTRNVFHLGENSQITILESTIHKQNKVRTIHNCFTEVFAEAGSKGDHVLIQKGNEKTTLISRENINLQRDSNFSVHTYTLAGKFTRNNIKISLDEKGAEGHMFGFYQLNGAEICDNHTLADHKAPHCMSNEHYKGILKGKSTGVFNGKVFVHPDAQKTNAYQQNNSIILEDEASMNSKPELEIYADDVKCSHGSTIGQLDEISLFYLKSRGIGEELARAMLIRAFADEIISKVENEQVRNYLDKEIN